MCLLLLKVVILSLFLYSKISFSDERTVVCTTLVNVINVNTKAYKNCLMQKSGENFSREELNRCKKYYITEIERLSYVYKNICRDKS